MTQLSKSQLSKKVLPSFHEFSQKGYLHAHTKHSNLPMHHIKKNNRQQFSGGMRYFNHHRHRFGHFFQGCFKGHSIEEKGSFFQ